MDIKHHTNFLRKIHQVLDLVIVAFAISLEFLWERGFFPFTMPNSEERQKLLLLLSLALVVYFLCFAMFKIYEPFRYKTFFSVIGRTIKAFAISVLIYHGLLFLLRVNISRQFFLRNLILTLSLLVVSKTVVYFVLASHRRRGFNFRRVLIVGTKTRAVELIKHIRERPAAGYKILGCIDVRQDSIGTPVFDDIKVIGALDDFQRIALGTTVDVVLFAIPFNISQAVGNCISIAESLGIDVMVFPDWQIHRLSIKPRSKHIFIDNFLDMPSIVMSTLPQEQTALFVKSCMDYAGAFCLLLLSAPFFLAIAAAIKFTSPGPVFYGQERCGLYGRRFVMHKFRTMCVNAESLRDELLTLNEMDGPVFKIKEDPRITPVGKYLRRTSLDELPQLFNVLKGEMSLVGPRPPIPAEVEGYEVWQRRRLSMKPGLTCIWQVGKRNKINFEEWMGMDLQYIDNWSLWLDIRLIIKTIIAVIKGKGM